MLQSASSSYEEGQGRAGRGCSRASWSPNCRHRTVISVRRLIKSMVEVMMCRKAMYRHQCQAAGHEHGRGDDVQALSSSNTNDCHQASKYSKQITQDAPEALLCAEAQA